ncbi:MAG: hypothetical protein LUB59_04665 [Candidatus Gastranaerophilales bacterium]|nr:hypothetical protein [Candidatus Gastranaerophilales bacterium]
MSEYDNNNSFESDNQNDTNSGGDNNANAEFSIPQEYENKGWTKFFDGKTGEELKNEVFKSYDNSQTLIGKKVEDYLTETDLKSLDNYEQIREQLVKQIAPDTKVPENAGDYAFNDILKDENGNLQYEYPQEVFDVFGNEFKKLGISKEQGQGILKAYTDFEINEFEKYTNVDELEVNINQLFNNNQEQRKNVEGLLREFLPEEDRQFLQKTAPNYTIMMFYKLAQGLENKYGYKEGTNNANRTSDMRMSEADKNAEYERLVAKMEELDSRPHTDAEKAQYQNALRKLFNA